VRQLDDFLPVYEFLERHEVEIRAGRGQVDRALHGVSVNDVRGIRLLYVLRGLGRTSHDASRPFLGLVRLGAVELDSVSGEGIVFGLTGQFWRLRGGEDLGRPRTPEEFIAYDRPDVCKAVIDFRIAQPDGGRCLLSTETRVHVEDPAARRGFCRYWRVIRPFSGLTRILFLREVRRQALEM
jgi:hypothetical protein